jgi:hypoxanthine phosphoribosyltransferase
MPSDERYNILALIDKKARVIALIALLADAALLATIPLLPSDQRIYGFVVVACLLVATLIGAVLVVARSTSQDHTQPHLRLRVRALKEKLVADRFLPQLIIAIPRGGLAVASILTRELGDEEILPVICLTRSQRRGFDSPFNHIHFTRSDFGRDGGGPIKILIVDDFCGSGRTLNEARDYVEGSLEPNGFVIKTAVISFYRSYGHPIAPSYFVDRPEKSIRDASGELEPMPE